MGKGEIPINIHEEHHFKTTLPHYSYTVSCLFFCDMVAVQFVKICDTTLE
ncbi:hypothetical protein [Porphyromonas sp. COT-108 OH1349]|nr:hypothetical protein [Porphyromonas sp. COT-108 OH1349]